MHTLFIMQLLHRRVYPSYKKAPTKISYPNLKFIFVIPTENIRIFQHKQLIRSVKSTHQNQLLVHLYMIQENLSFYNYIFHQISRFQNKTVKLKSRKSDVAVILNPIQTGSFLSQHFLKYKRQHFKTCLVLKLQMKFFT